MAKEVAVAEKRGTDVPIESTNRSPTSAARRAKDDGSGKRPSGDPIAIVRRVIDSVVGLEVDPHGDTVPLDLSVDQLLAVGQLAAKLAELQQTEYRDGLELARLALEHQTPTDPASTDAGSTTNEGATK